MHCYARQKSQRVGRESDPILCSADDGQDRNDKPKIHQNATRPDKDMQLESVRVQSLDLPRTFYGFTCAIPRLIPSAINKLFSFFFVFGGLPEDWLLKSREPKLLLDTELEEAVLPLLALRGLWPKVPILRDAGGVPGAVLPGSALRWTGERESDRS